MKWHKYNPVCLHSDCGGYAVTKNGNVYQAIRLGRKVPVRDSYDWPDAVSLLVADSADKCKAACEGDRR